MLLRSTHFHFFMTGCLSDLLEPGFIDVYTKCRRIIETSSRGFFMGFLNTLNNLDDQYCSDDDINLPEHYLHGNDLGKFRDVVLGKFIW